jgi:orotate phosphoribosyltransferase-like protein
VVGIPRGGVPFAQALAPFVTPGSKDVLIVDDVLTTGQSMENERKQYPNQPVTGVVVFNRALLLSDWIVPIFDLDSAFIG